MTEPPGESTRTTSALRLPLRSPSSRLRGDPVAAGVAGAALAVDDLAGDGQHADLAAVVARPVLVGPGLVMDGAVAARHALVARAGELGHAPAEGGAVADPVDQAGVQRGPRHVAVRRLDEARRIGDIGGDLRARPGAADVVLPGLPERVGERLRRRARLGRHVAARIGLDRRLVGADAVDVGGDPEPLEQPGIIEVGAARPGDQHRAQRIEPDFVGMGGELIAVVAIAGRIGDDALARAPHPVERLADIGDRALPAAGEADRDRAPPP